MVPKDCQQLESLLVKSDFLGVQTRSCCVQWSGFSTWIMGLIYNVLRGFVSGRSMNRRSEGGLALFDSVMATVGWLVFS